MSDEKNIESFFENPFAEDYIHLSEENLRFSVMAISSACDELRYGTASEAERQIYLDVIMKMCCRLMQSAELSAQLRNSFSDNEVPKEAVSMGRFLRETADGCNLALGSVFTVRSEADDMLFVYTSRHLLRYILTGVIRRGVKDGAKSALVKAEQNDGIVSIKVVFDSIQKTYAESPVELSYNYFKDINNVLSEKIGGKFSFDGVTAEIKLPVPPENGELELCSPEEVYGSSAFSVYNVMLGDLSDNIFY